MSHTARILFRVEASPQIGLGHLQRSLSLAQALTKCGAESVFLLNEDDRGRNRVQKAGIKVETLSGAGSWTEGDVENTLELGHRNGSNMVVVDSHEVGADYLAQLRSAGLFVATRDDLARYPFPCQLVFNGNADACQLDYRSSSGDTIFLLGPEYVVLRQELWEPLPRKLADDVKKVLVTLGGSDPLNLMPGILNMLEDLPGDFSVTAVIGPFFQNAEEVKLTASSCKRMINLDHSPDSLTNLVSQADLAVSAGGQTMYELASTGCPAVAISVASNQQGQLSSLAETGSVTWVGDAEKDDVIPDLKKSLGSLLPDAEARTAMANVGQKLVDGGGALRVARKLLETAQCGNFH